MNSNQDAATAATTPVRAMPLGDSITRGLIIPPPGMVPGGYRAPLYQRLTREWGPVVFVGSANDNPDPDRLPCPNHEGHGGFRIDEIAAGIELWLDRAGPDVILLHIGTNDMAQGFDLARAPARLRDLIEKIAGRSPKAYLLVAQIISSTDAETQHRIERYNAAIPGIVDTMRAAGHDVLTVNMFDVVPANGFADPYHPNALGYARIADAWFDAIRLLPVDALTTLKSRSDSTTPSRRPPV
ncbi:MAG: SGNH/GDSL hydrolase family protein [Planctomycetota bacterium]